MNWIGDGKDGASIDVQDDTILNVRGGDEGTPFNVRLDLRSLIPDYYFQALIHEVTGSLSVGVVAPDEFQSGWKSAGMFYNGNLTNGSAALAVNWGPRFGSGDSVGVRVITTSESVEVVFYKNGKSLGTGFLIENQSSQIYCPCFSIVGDAKLRCEIPAELPPQELYVAEDLAMAGPWSLAEAIDDDGTALTMPGRPATMELSRDQATLRFAFKVGNPISGSAKIIDEHGDTLTLEMGSMLTGLMMTPPVLREIESYICSLNATSLTMSNGRLILRNGHKKTVWKRNPRDPLALPSYRN